MPVYFFDTDYSGKRFRDDRGTHLRNDRAARDEAVQALAEMGKDYIPSNGAEGTLTMRVRNSDGTPVLHLGMSFAIGSLSTKTKRAGLV